jgi:hypothetical protein
MGLVTPGVPERLISELIGNFPIKTFIEMGTYKGATAEWAARNFANVITVEAAHSIVELARQKLGALPNVRVLHADSRQVLPAICSELLEPAIFWLDSHWSGGATAGIEDECPLLEELSIVLLNQPEHILLIDDARFFLCAPAYPLTPEQWPSLSEIINVVKQLRPNYDVWVVDDVILVFPPKVHNLLQSYCQERGLVMEWRLGVYLKFLDRPSLRNLLLLFRVLGGVVLKRAGWLPEVSKRVKREARKRFGNADD